jgi:hypothetical protein
MSDFFLNLATRVRGNENAIRPRVAGRFEPTEPMAKLAEASEEIVRGVDETRAAAPPRQSSPQSAMSGHEVTIEGEPVPQAIALPASSEPHRPVAPGRVDAPRPDPTMRHEFPPDMREKTSTVDLPTISLRTPANNRAEWPQQSETPPAKREAHIPGRTVTSPSKAQTAVSELPSAGSAPNAPIVAAPADHPAGIMTPQREPFVAQRSGKMPRSPEALPPQETVVHVTIGRVELRAPAAAPPRKPEQAASQAGTLAEYLQKHAARTRS